MGLGHRADEGVEVERAEAAEVDDLGVDALARKPFGGREGRLETPAVADEGDVGAGALDVGLADGDEVVALGDLALVAVEHLMLDEDDRVVGPDRALEQALGVGRGPGHDDGQAGDVGEDGFRPVRVGGREAARHARGAAEHDRDGELAARHVPHVGGVVDDLVDGDPGEAEGHELDDRAEAHHRGADADAGEAFLGDRRVDHAAGAELVEEALADLVGPVVLGDLFPHQEDAIVPLHLLGHRLIQGFAIRQDRHGPGLTPAGCAGPP